MRQGPGAASGSKCGPSSKPQMHKCAVSPVTLALGAVVGEGPPLTMPQELRTCLSPATLGSRE